MLWYKVWLETRARFLLCLATMTVFCAIFIHHAQGLLHPVRASDFNRLLFVNQQFLVIMWVLSAVLLGMGGIVREKAMGTSSLTLGLPVSRARLMAVRIGIGVLEAIVLGLVPWLIVFAVSRLGGMPVLVAQVRSYFLLLVGGGSAYFAMAVLVSSWIEGEYTAPAFAFGIVLLSAILFDVWLKPFNLWRVVTGDFYIDRKTYLLPTHFPWMGVSLSLALTVLMFLLSVKLIQRREF